MVGTGVESQQILLWVCYLVISVAFAALAFRLRAVTGTGAAVGALICFLICMGSGFAGLAALLALFALAWLTTKIGYRRKENLGTAEKIEGRNAHQVMANLGIAAIGSILHVAKSEPVFLLAIAASLSEAAADTVSSEIGQLSDGPPRLITNWTKVPAGTDGGVTVMGTLSGLGAAVLVTAICALGRMVSCNRIYIPVLAALCGTIADSFLGAWLERRKLLNNDLVNFLSTLVAATIALVS